MIPLFGISNPDEEDLLCKSIEVLGETAHAVSLRTSLHTMRCANFTASAASFE